MPDQFAGAFENSFRIGQERKTLLLSLVIIRRLANYFPLAITVRMGSLSA